MEPKILQIIPAPDGEAYLRVKSPKGAVRGAAVCLALVEDDDGCRYVLPVFSDGETLMLADLADDVSWAS